MSGHRVLTSSSSRKAYIYNVLLLNYFLHVEEDTDVILVRSLTLTLGNVSIFWLLPSHLSLFLFCGSFFFLFPFSYSSPPSFMENYFLLLLFSNMINVNFSNSHILWSEVRVWSCSGFVPKMVTNPSDCSTCAVLFPQRCILGDGCQL